ncbi:MAG: hypothetical protein LBU61_06660 [Coriobacteriales bacterium]|jgi:hypothetical protein|nr:hypothetical protein [Coriobacteriales bacterium]
MLTSLSRRDFVKTTILCASVLSAPSLALASSVNEGDTNTYSSFFAENNNLSDEEILQRFKIINEKYVPFEPLSESDADFVRKYATNANQQPRTGTNFDKTVTKFGTTINYSGYIYHENTSAVLEKIYGGDVVAQRTAGLTPTSMTAYVHCTAYGVGSNDSIFIVHDGTMSYNVKDTNTLRMSMSRDFFGFILFYHLCTYLDVSTSQGSFTISF